MYGHSSIINMRDTQNSDLTWGIHHLDNPQSDGTIEFFNANHDGGTGSALKRYYLHFRASDDTIAFRIQINVHNGEYRYYDGISWQLIGTGAPIEKWYHHRVFFDCNSGSKGVFTWILSYENGTEISRVSNIEFENDFNGKTIDELYFTSTLADWRGDCFFDAFGYSWDPDYNIGDNLNEGLLLSYTNTTQLDWMGYSLDGQTNRTILGNTTIPLPNNNQHTIQVFGNNTSGIYYASEIRQFSVKTGSIEITTPEDITYTEPMEGYFSGTYGFENDEVGTLIPKNFSEFSWEPCEGIIIDEIDGHKNVYRAYDNYISGSQALFQRFTADSNLPNKTYGTIESWIRVTSVTPYTVIRLNWDYGINDCAIDFRIYNGKWGYHNGIDWQDLTSIIDPVPNQWFHLRFDFRCSGAPSYNGLSFDEFEVYVNEESLGIHEFKFSSTEIVGFMPVYTEWGPYGGGNYAYVDSIGYSWDPNYNIGDNLNEGLLLSYTNSTELDWMGYSMDGQTNRTILGNTTIPLPNNNQHTIQVFGNNTSGMYYASNLIQFTVDYHPIEILTPEAITYIEPMEDLSLSFTTSAYFDWMGYSIDGLLNITILGNTTISLPENGPHIIQVFGKTPSGNYYASNIRQFIIDIQVPVIIGIDAIIEVEQYSLCKINWTISALYGRTYVILKDGEIEGGGVFQNDDKISINVDTSNSGRLNYTIIAIDSYGRESNDTIIIQVKPREIPPIPGYDIVTLFTVISILIILISLITKRKFKIRK